MSDFYSKITAPITGDDPFGADMNYDIDYERLKSEIGKLGDIDTDVVESLSFKILTEKSKDARVLAFLAYSMLRQNDFGRIADVFCALADYCENSFEQIYPRRQGAKVAALRWFCESRFSGQCEKVTVTAADAENAARLADEILKLRQTLDQKLSDSAPPLSLLSKRAAEWKKTAENAAKPVVSPVESSVNTNDACGDSDDTNQQEDVCNDEYDEILQYVKKIETLVINLKQRTVV
ncbi:MAG: type VI secretion system ImpA family N-terminal domain-containing protein [Chitinispirillia bacterium]|nr:type VI secretion system ImpA family N-terminal domain-containing protein [Chitinispirillia bacterium]